MINNVKTVLVRASLALVVGFGIVADADSQGPNRMLLRYPRVGVSKASGLFVGVTDDGLGHGQFGYRRIFCGVNSPSPLIADAEIKVRLSVGISNKGTNLTTVEQATVMSAGTTSATLTLRIPQNTEWRRVWWDVYVDGTRDAELSCSLDRSEPVYSYVSARWEDQMMLVLDRRHGVIQNFSTISSTSTLGVGHYRISEELSDNWLDYTPYDAIKISHKQLVDLDQYEPEKLAALCQWVRSGGMVWLSNAGQDWQSLPKIHKIFGWREAESINPVKPERNTPTSEHEWQYMILNQVINQDQVDGLQNDYGAAPEETQGTRTSAGEDPVYSEGWIVERRCGWGTVLAFEGPADNIYNREYSKYQDNLSKQIIARAWNRKHGLLPGYSNVDFSDWLIPGVGLAPVISFQVLITLFVIGIGPLNYWLLRRAGRLHLMVITVPVAALIVTGSLLAYGFLADGFGTRVRVQSITFVNQAESKGATWNRLSYYASFTPSGLSFSDQTAVYRIEPDSENSRVRRQKQGQRQIEWGDDEQKLARGWLGSRTPTQYLTLEPREVAAKLTTRLGANPIAKSTYDNPAVLVLVHGDDEEWYVAEETPVDESFALTPIQRDKASAKLRKYLSENQPEKPIGLDSVNNAPLLSPNDWRYFNRSSSFQPIDSSASNSLLARRYKELPNLNLPPRSYVIVAEEALLPFAADDNATEDSSIHIVVGTW